MSTDSDILTNLRWHALHANDRAHDLFKAVQMTQRRGEPFMDTPRLIECLAGIADQLGLAMYAVTELQQRASPPGAQPERKHD